MGGVSNFGMRRSMDMVSRFDRAGLPVYLRVTVPSADPSQDEFAQFGFQAAASGALVTQDVLIDPPPQVKQVSLHDIGLNSAQLSFGSRTFKISHSWVIVRQQLKGYWEPGTQQPDFTRVFIDPSVVGIWTDGRLFKIVSITHEDLGGRQWMWDIIGDAPLLPLTK